MEINKINETLNAQPGNTIKFKIATDGLPYAVDAENIDKFLSSRVSGYYEILDDLSRAKECLIECSKTDSSKSVMRNALFIDAIASYCRCFNKSEGRGFSLSTKKKTIVNLDLHNEMIHHRNTLVGHAGENKFRSSWTYILSDSPSKPTRTAVATYRLNIENVSNADLAIMINHIENIHKNTSITYRDVVHRLEKKARAILE